MGKSSIHGPCSMAMLVILPSGKHTKNYGQSTHCEWQNSLFLLAIFNSYVMLNNQRVS